MITILDTVVNIDKFEMPNIDYKSPLSGRVQFYSYGLNEKENEEGFAFAVRMNFYGTNIDTDFILDADISCMVLFTIRTLVPTVNDLFDAYKQANRFSNVSIYNCVVEAGIENWSENFDDVPFKTIREELNETIEKFLMKE